MHKMPAAISELPRTITVVGEGQIRIKPDIARATIGVVATKPTVQQASAENKQAIELILAALKEQGIAAEDIQTSHFSIYTERNDAGGPVDESEYRYQVNNNVTVVVRNLDNLGKILDAAIEAGANNMYGVEFSLDNPDALESSARKAAMEDARAKAEELAQLAGVAVGDVIAMSEIIGANGYYAGGSFAQPAYGLGGGGNVPASPGQLKMNMQIQVTYALDES